MEGGDRNFQSPFPQLGAMTIAFSADVDGQTAGADQRNASAASLAGEEQRVAATPIPLCGVGALPVKADHSAIARHHPLFFCAGDGKRQLIRINPHSRPRRYF
jgi:hypothetical protein